MCGCTAGCYKGHILQDTCHSDTNERMEHLLAGSPRLPRPGIHVKKLDTKERAGKENRQPAYGGGFWGQFLSQPRILLQFAALCIFPLGRRISLSTVKSCSKCIVTILVMMAAATVPVLGPSEDPPPTVCSSSALLNMQWHGSPAFTP